jgi:hypothetical protein
MHWRLFSLLTRMCSRCRRKRHDGWPAKNGGELCQMCWEWECNEEYRAWLAQGKAT